MSMIDNYTWIDLFVSIEFGWTHELNEIRKWNQAYFSIKSLIYLSKNFYHFIQGNEIEIFNICVIYINMVETTRPIGAILSTLAGNTQMGKQSWKADPTSLVYI
ncbi:unnamed protein product [Blepharisma stoltei]|uniref:Maturase K n=1 Tax=Blepharisma stoltei TaxID=1481888 RepID=A0AAU9JL15_9CILI|nr:unnamed protein product [Blepharisma stoltei]